MKDPNYAQLTVIGHDVDIDYTSGGQVVSIHGRLINLDDHGFVVIEGSDGLLVCIPKDKVESIRESAKTD